MISLICFLITFIAICSIVYFPINKMQFLASSPFIGLGFPLLFEIKRKDIRNIAITLCIVSSFLYMRWISWICIILTYTILFWAKHKILFISGLVLMISFFPILGMKIKELNNPINEMKIRINQYDELMNKWKKIWFGEGWRTFSKLPENQPENREDKKWLHVVHSDLLQGFYELGVVRMIPILTILLLPLAFIKLGSPITISYLNLLFQGLIEFPFHRLITGSLGILIIFMIYKVIFEGKCERYYSS